MEALDRIELTVRRALDNPKRANHAMGWYGRACAWIAEDVAARHGLHSHKVAGFVAALSPQNGWKDQLQWTDAQLTAALSALDTLNPTHRTTDAEWSAAAATLPGPGFRANKTKALRIAAGAPPLSVLSGPKVQAFFANLTGDLQPVTVDRHAFTIAYGPDFSGHLTAHRYRTAARAYAAVAALFGMLPAESQALAWCYFKNETEGKPW